MDYRITINYLYSVDVTGQIKPTNDSTAKFKKFPSYKKAEMEIARIIENDYDVHSYNILPCNESKNN
jgi:hypothetical protein